MIRGLDSGCCGGRRFTLAVCDWCGHQQKIPTPPKTQGYGSREALQLQWNWVFLDLPGEEGEIFRYHFHSRQCRAAFRKEESRDG